MTSDGASDAQGDKQTRVAHTKADATDVYAGRGPGGRGMDETPIGERGWLGNPYPVHDYDSRAACIEAFRADFVARLKADPEFREAVRDLAGKTLGCWCQSLDDDGPACHAEVIAEWADRLADEDQDEELVADGGQDASAVLRRAEELDKPYRDEEILRELYVEQMLPAMEVADKLDCAASSVLNWLHRNDLPVRSHPEAMEARHGELGKYRVTYHTMKRGHEEWYPSIDCEMQRVYVHRLAAVAWFGFDAVVGNDVHHENGIPWDNREENISVLPHGEHSSQHRKFGMLDRLRVAEMYEHGDASSRGLADAVDFGISSGSVLRCHEELYGGATADA